MSSGTVVTLIGGKTGYFFLSKDDGGGDILCQRLEIDKAGLDRPRIGSRYSFDIAQTPRGDIATNLKSIT
jgi:cold shock CspA family protein